MASLVHEALFRIFVSCPQSVTVHCCANWQVSLAILLPTRVQEQQRLWAPDAPASDAPSPKQPAGSGAAAGGAAGGSKAATAVQVEEDLLSDAGTEWSDGVAFAHRAAAAQQQDTGFRALMRTREVWAICAAQYTGGQRGRKVPPAG